MKKKITIDFIVPEFIGMEDLRQIFDRGLQNYIRTDYWVSEDTVYGFSLEGVQVSKDWNQVTRLTETLILTAIKRRDHELND